MLASTFTRIRSQLRLGSIATVAFGLCLGAGCDPVDEFGEEDLDEEACRELQMQGGPPMSIPASSEPDISAQTVRRDELNIITYNGTGYLLYSTTGGETIFFVDTDIEFGVLSTIDQQSLFVERNNVLPACTDVNGRYVVTFPEDGGTYYLELGPKGEEDIMLVIKSPEL